MLFIFITRGVPFRYSSNSEKLISLCENGFGGVPSLFLVREDSANSNIYKKNNRIIILMQTAGL